MSEIMESAFHPRGWGTSEMSEASMQMEAFVPTKGYAWVQNWLGCEMRKIERQMLAAEPWRTEHGKYIALSCRYKALNEVTGAMAKLISFREEDHDSEEGSS